MRLHLLTAVCAVIGAACYSGSRATPDVNAAWRGHARVELEARLGEPRAVVPQPDGTSLLRWSRQGQHIELPSGSLEVDVTSKDADSFVMGHSWAFAAQYWPAARLAVRAGPAMVLDLDPGLEDPTLSPGAVGALSYALVRSGSFVLDLRFDATLSTSAAFGTLGVGVNVN